MSLHSSDSRKRSVPIVTPVYRDLRDTSRAPLPGASPSDREIAQLIARWEVEDARFCADLENDVLPATALTGLGVRLCLQNRNVDARQALTAAITLAPSNVEPLNNLAVVLERSGLVDQALQCVQKSLSLSDGQVDSWIYLGALKKQTSDLIGAAEAYRRAIALDPSNAISWQGLGLVLHQQREFQESIASFIQCLKLNHATAPVLAILGQLYYTTGQLHKSLDAYTAAAEVDASNAHYHQMLVEVRFACALIDGAELDGAELDGAELEGAGLEILPNTLTSQEKTKELLHKTFVLLSSYGYHAAAEKLARLRVSLFPDDATGQYLLDSIKGNRAIQRSPDAFLIDSFNQVADRFDEHLVKGLGYDIPKQLCQWIKPFIDSALHATPLSTSINNSPTKLNVLDAGCGTGLCGPHIMANFNASLTGVDLADRMLQHAAARNLYDELVCTELTSYLQSCHRRFDLIIAADVLIYFGDLKQLAHGFAECLHSGGLLAVSIERGDDRPHQLLSSGRFSHSSSYIQSVFDPDFQTMASLPTTLRLEADRRIPGELWLFRRR